MYVVNIYQLLTTTWQKLYEFFRNESKFLLGGLKVDNKPTWQERQEAFMTAVKAFLTKLKPEFEEIKVKYVRSMRVNPRLFLVVECSNTFE